MVEPEELARFCHLLRSLLCGDDNERRKEAERVYQTTKQVHPDALCRCLLHVLVQAPDATLRQQSAVLLRQCLKPTRSDFVWPRLSPETQAGLKLQLVLALGNEQDQRTRHRICDALAALACHLLDPAAAAWAAWDSAALEPASSGGVAGWPELAQALAAAAADGAQPAAREAALRLLREALAASPGAALALDGQAQAQAQAQGMGGQHGAAGPWLLLRLLGACLQMAEAGTAAGGLALQKEAVLLHAAALEHLPEQSEGLRQLLPATLRAMQQLSQQEEDLRECLESLVPAVDAAPNSFQQHLDVAVPMMLTISRARGRLQDGVRQIAFEFLVSLCQRKAKMCAKFPHFVREAIRLCMDFMLELEDDEDWVNEDDLWKVDVSNYDVGAQNVDRFARSLGAGAVLEHVFEGVRSFVSQEGWKHKYVAIMTLSQCAETVQDEAHVDEIVHLLLSLLADKHPRVRYAALHAIGQTSTDHCPHVQEQHSEVVLPALSRLMDDQVAKVAAHACAAFVNFTEDLDYELLLPYVPGLMAKLCQKMTSPVRVVREQAITAIAVIAGVVQTEFVPYYQAVVPVLKQVVLTATGKDERALRGKAFECLSLLGLAVGRDVFQQDAREAMQAMMETASRGLEADDPQKSYIYEAAQRICRALKEQFLPYLQYLLPGIHAMLRMQPTEVLDPDAEDQEEDMTVAFLNDGQAVGLRTSQIEDFRSAVELTACFLEVLGGHYYDHVRETASCLLPALSFRFSDDVKREAVQTWQELITAARAGLAQRGLEGTEAARLVPELLQAFLGGAMEAMRVEEDLETLQVQAVGTAACLRAAGPGALGAEEVRGLCIELRQLMDESTQRQWKWQAEAPHNGQQQPDRDEDELAEAAQLSSAEQLLRVKLAELTGAVMEVHKVHFLAHGLEQFVPLIQACVQLDQSVADRCFALYLASDVLEKLEHEGVGTLPIFIGPTLTSLTDSDPWVRQAAAYVALHGSHLLEFAPFADTCARSIVSMLGQPCREGEGQREAREAAVAALGQLCRAQGQHLQDLEGCLQHFLSGLPLVEDVDQAGPTHETLLDFVQDGHTFFQRNAARVCSVFLEVYNRETSSERLNAGIRQVLLQVRSQLEQLQPPLSQKQRRRVEKILRDAQRARG